MASLDFFNVTRTAISVQLTGLDLTSQTNMGTANLPRHNSYRLVALGEARTLEKGSGGTSGFTTYEGLTPGTSYSFMAIVSFSGGDGVTKDIYLYGSQTTAGEAPTRFDWDYAGQDKTTGSLVSGVEKKSGLGVYVSADEWNRLLGAIYAKTVTVIPRVSRGDTISAARVNLAAQALGVATVTQNVTPISADFFNQLRTAVNKL